MSAAEDQRQYPAGRDSPARVAGAPGHDEWLIDESIAESFPASDPPAPPHPGSTVGMRYPIAASRSFPHALRLPGSAAAWAAICLSLVCIALLSRRR
ncbi:MAG TPA: hypothetical protein VHP37_22800 [Burkholderiales bacterium]|nr:hypothetical protein [Burkholderiales bacterium]